MRQRPAMFIYPVSLTALWHFILGYGMGLGSVSCEIENPFALPRDFHDWVAYRLHFYESTRGFHNMIIERLGDGPQAVDRFFSLMSEYQNREPRIVATLVGCSRTYRELFQGEERRLSFPSTISLIAYNDEDPGLFVTAEGVDHFPGKGLCPNLASFEADFGRCESDLSVLDRAAYERWAEQSYPE